jgi:ceramide glucosyltransferase
VIVAALLVLTAASLILAAVQAFALHRHLRSAAPEPRATPLISILKPLCGVDDNLWTNLRSFARLDYPGYEVLLGVKDKSDRAYPVALDAAERWPRLMRVVVQRGAPGLNPKVNQLITLASAARGEILVVSDSNVRVRRDYLRGIAAGFDDPQVGLVTHLLAGAGERSAGALLDNLFMCGAIAPGIVSAKCIAGKDLVVGKSMALRARDLRAMGGFERLKNVLAEDFLCGRIVTGELGKKVVVAAGPVINVSRRQRVGAFFSRHLRWSVMQRKAVGNAVYAAQIILNPTALAFAAFAASPGRWTGAALFVAGAVRALLHEAAARALRGHGFSLRCLVAPVSDLAVGCAWAAGFFRSEVSWRGNRLAVREGTRLERIPEEGLRPAQPQAGIS